MKRSAPFLLCVLSVYSCAQSVSQSRVTIESEGWKLIGDLVLPKSKGKLPVALMLNRAGGNRAEYHELAKALARRGIASLRLDLPGHGESTNLGKFVPGAVEQDPLIWDAEKHVISVHKWLKSNPKIDSSRICMVGSSYSGEEVAEAGRIYEYARAYVELSPGSFGDASIDGIDQSGVPWFFIVSNDERWLKEITAEVQVRSKTVELLIVPGAEHVSRLLEDRPSLCERIAVWIGSKLAE